MVEKNAFIEKMGWVLRKCWKKYAYFEKNGWVGDFDAFAKKFSVCSAIFFLTPPPPGSIR